MNARIPLLLLVIGVDVLAGPAHAQSIDTQANQIGRLTSVGNGPMRRYFEYDALGRATRTEHVLDGVSHVFATTYGYPQNPTTTPGPGTVAKSMTFPDGERVDYTYDASGAQQTVTTTPWPAPAVTETVVSRIERNARGQTTTVVYGNGAVTTHTYNDQTDLRLNRIFTSRPGTPDIQDYRYSFDPPGNVTAVQDMLVPWLSGEYTYDSLDQIESMNGSLRYRYDVTGNLIEIEGLTQVYGGAGQRGPHALAASDGRTYQYDFNGNVTSISDGTVLTWNAENMATKAVRGGVTKNEKFFLGESVWKKVEGGVTTFYLPSLRIENGQPRKYFGTFAERAVEDGGLKFYHSDHLGSSTVVTNTSGDVVHRIAYKPYGEDRGPAGGSFFPKYQFNFKEKESTGYYDYGARLYNPTTGRWLSADTYLRDGTNRYSYVNNNPLKYIDPTGHFMWPLFPLFEQPKQKRPPPPRPGKDPRVKPPPPKTGKPPQTRPQLPQTTPNAPKVDSVHRHQQLEVPRSKEGVALAPGLLIHQVNAWAPILSQIFRADSINENLANGIPVDRFGSPVRPGGAVYFLPSDNPYGTAMIAQGTTSFKTPFGTWVGVGAVRGEHGEVYPAVRLPDIGIGNPLFWHGVIPSEQWLQKVQDQQPGFFERNIAPLIRKE